MNITEKKIDDLNLELSMVVEAADYAEPLEKKLKEIRHKAEFKGFRKGMVPMSLIKKVYGDQALADVINTVIGEQLDSYINGNKLNILGEPLQSANQPELDWKEGSDFTFVFDIALAPELNFEVSAEDSVTSYKITLDAKTKEETVKNYKEFWSKKKDAPAKTDEEIEKEVTARLESQYADEASWRLSADIRKFLVEKSGIALPEAFLKRWLETANKDKYTPEELEKQFPGFLEDLKWQLVCGYLMRKYEFKVEEDDLRAAAKSYISMQYAMYGMNDFPEDLIKEAVDNMMTDSNQLSRLVEMVENNKVIDKVRGTVTLKSKRITAAKFREL